ncbi:DUF4127 family protein [uncultured Mitsuokella sp.]|uniref:DUF4127 family protein n=1 Tax=uncultured Mitsuokella sp. TaxID=453120 RepID=UPI002595BB55|nr:DUF4127 family protein [uncultured Mitsuokella sp.]
MERYRKRRALLILVLVPLLALGLWNLRALRHPAGTPVSPQETTAHHVILVPLDGRPPCRQFVIDAGRIGGTEVVTPPHELQDYYSQPGDTKAMRRWLLEEVAKGTIDAVFLSVDQLLYGGLLTAREKQATPAEVEEFLAFLRELHEANPAVPIYAFSILPRLTPQDTIDGYDERRDIMAYSRLAGRQAAGLPVDETKLAALKAKIPPASLERYLAHFRENATLNERLIDLTHEGTLARLVLGQDDGEEYGIPNIEKYALLDYIKSLGLSDRQVFLTHGADEIALSLLAAWHNEQTGYAPKIFVAYNDPGARDRVMPYMAVSTGVCTEEKIRLTGGSLAASPEEADFTLLVSTNDTDKDTLWSRGACVRLLEDNLAKGQPTALVDLSKHFNADETVLPQLIAAAFPVNHLLAYAGWNTTSNAIGTAVAQACLYRSSLPDVRDDDQAIGLAAAQVRFLENRILEDYFYLKEDIDIINGTLKKAGYTNTADLDLDRNYRWANMMLRASMTRHLRVYRQTDAFRAPFPVDAPSGTIWLQLHDLQADMSFPWPRTFEIYLETTPFFERLSSAPAT